MFFLKKIYYKYVFYIKNILENILFVNNIYYYLYLYIFFLLFLFFFGSYNYVILIYNIYFI